MSKTKKKNKKEKISKLKVPNGGIVWDANWRDDIAVDEKKQKGRAIKVGFNDFAFFRDEKNYFKREKKRISSDVQGRIVDFNLRRLGRLAVLSSEVQVGKAA